jgi:hypothetical protein
LAIEPLYWNTHFGLINAWIGMGKWEQAKERVAQIKQVIPFDNEVNRLEQVIKQYEAGSLTIITNSAHHSEKKPALQTKSKKK